MSSIHRAPATTKIGNDFFVNVAAFAAGNSYTYNETTGALTANGAVPAGFTAGNAGTVLVKDMGKTVHYQGGTYRKVQANSLASAASGQDYTTYILLAQDNSNAGIWARMTVQA
jgi:hypothetical protein